MLGHLRGTAAPLALLAGQCLAHDLDVPCIRRLRCGEVDAHTGLGWEIDWRPCEALWPPLWAAISTVVAPANTGTGAGTTNTIAVDATGGDYLYIAMARASDITTAVPSVVTYAGVGLTKLANTTGSADHCAQAWGLKSPSTGSNNLVVDWAGASGGEGPILGWTVLTGVGGTDSADAVRTTNVDSTFGTSVSLALSGLTIGDFVILNGTDFSDTTHTAGGGLTEHFEQSQGACTLYWADLTADATTETPAVTAGDSLIAVAVALKVAAGGGSTFKGQVIWFN